MTRAAADTSVIVAALLGWHEQHEPARTALDSALADRSLVVPAPALLESYAVMTRLPSPHRLGPADAAALLRDTLKSTPLITLEPRELWALVNRLEEKRIAGGRTHDAHILACARKAGAAVLLTFNEKDFASLDPDPIVIHNPGRPIEP